MCGFPRRGGNKGCSTAPAPLPRFTSQRLSSIRGLAWICQSPSIVLPAISAEYPSDGNPSRRGSNGERTSLSLSSFFFRKSRKRAFFRRMLPPPPARRSHCHSAFLSRPREITDSLQLCPAAAVCRYIRSHFYLEIRSARLMVRLITIISVSRRWGEGRSLNGICLARERVRFTREREAGSGERAESVRKQAERKPKGGKGRTRARFSRTVDLERRGRAFERVTPPHSSTESAAMGFAEEGERGTAFTAARKWGLHK